MTELDQYEKPRKRSFLGVLTGVMAALVVLIVSSFMFIALIFAVIFFFHYLMTTLGYTEPEAFATALMFIIAAGVILTFAKARR